MLLCSIPPFLHVQSLASHMCESVVDLIGHLEMGKASGSTPHLSRDGATVPAAVHMDKCDIYRRYRSHRTISQQNVRACGQNR